jgi:hypothetical protein
MVIGRIKRVFAVSKVIRMSKDARDQGGDIGVKMGL